MKATTSPATLTHYTTTEGLLGILDTAALWSTHIRQLNDFQETLDGLPLAESAASGHPWKEDAPADEVLNDIGRTVRMDDLFVTAFTTESDDLSMWRGYSPLQVKFAIEFNTDPLLASLGEHSDLHPELVQVTYTPEDLKRCVFDECEEVNYAGANSNSWIVTRRAVSHKGASWSAEHEYRLLTRIHGHDGGNDGAAIQYRPGPFGIAPYVALALAPKGSHIPNGVIKAIHVGPGPWQDACMDALSVMQQARASRTSGRYEIRASRLSLR